jgi:hypothetical protein
MGLVERALQAPAVQAAKRPRRLCARASVGQPDQRSAAGLVKSTGEPVPIHHCETNGRPSASRMK